MRQEASLIQLDESTLHLLLFSWYPLALAMRLDRALIGLYVMNAMQLLNLRLSPRQFDPSTALEGNIR